MDSIATLDFGAQYSQLIARRVREAHIYCELFPWDAPAEDVLALKPRAFILSGGPNSVYEPGAPSLPGYVIDSGLPVLGICYGMQLMACALGGHVAASDRREYGRTDLRFSLETLLVPHHIAHFPFHVWMSHGDKVDQLPPGFVVTATSPNCPISAMEDRARRLFALQFHPEVNHTQYGREILGSFLSQTGVRAEWTPGSMAEEAVEI